MSMRAALLLPLLFMTCSAIDMKTRFGGDQKADLSTVETKPQKATATIYRGTRYFQDSRYMTVGFGAESEKLGIKFDRSIQQDITEVLNNCISKAPDCIADGLAAAWKHKPCMMWHALLGPRGQVSPTWIKENDHGGLGMGPNSQFASATWGDYQVEIFGFDYCE